MDESYFFRVSDHEVAYELYLPDFKTDYIQKLLADSGKPYEVDMLRDMAARLNPGDLVLDVGANIGNHALYLALAARAKVIAYEPNEHLAAALELSIAHNSLGGDLEVRAIGIGDTYGSACFEAEIADNLGAQRLLQGQGDIKVVTLDSESFIGPVRMIKIDVEGMELAALRGAQALLARDRPLVYVESQDEAQFRDLSRWMIRNGYSYWETFNLTPTHLFLPKDAVSSQDRMERLLAREVVQEYRYGVQLRRARRFQRAAEERAEQLSRQLGGTASGDVLPRIEELRKVIGEGLGVDLKQIRSDIAATRSEVVDMRRLEVGRLEEEIDRRGRQIRHMRKQVADAQARLVEIEGSTAYQLGLTLALAGSSPKGVLRLPLELYRLIRRALARRVRSRAAAADLQTRFPANPVPELQNWLDARPMAKEAASVLYADINLNIVDGSSVWLSSMASILCSRGKCVLVSKVPLHSEIVVSNIRSRENLAVVSPEIFGLATFDMPDATRLIRELDGLVPGLRRIVVRGTDAAAELLSDRQFEGRAAVYLTDFYTIEGNGRRVSDEQRRKVAGCLEHADLVLVQTPQIEQELRSTGGASFAAIELPPPIPDVLPSAAGDRRSGDRVRIGYAGKVNSRWGVLELLEWSQKASQSLPIELHIAANKISNGPDPGCDDLKQRVPRMIEAVGGYHYSDLNRESAMSLLSTMDFVWCWRPARLEENTIELSTKLVEMVAAGARCICYPSEINKRALGPDYPFFIKDYEDFLALLQAQEWGDVPREAVTAIVHKHSIARIVNEVGDVLLPSPDTQSLTKTLLFAGHDFKFIDAYASHLKRSGKPVLRDVWEWGRCRDEQHSREMGRQADVVFCEWGLANAAWYSKNLPSSKRLIIRLHAQEVRERARRFGAEIDPARVDGFVFVSDEIRRKALEIWRWPEEKTLVVPNYVLDEEFTMQGRRSSEILTLGMLGIVPSLKRFDRALDVLAALVEDGIDAKLKVKGHRPEMLEFMRVPERAGELEEYQKLYKRIEGDESLKDKVVFEPWGNDVADWYKDVDIILSCSDTESFHYALADGALSGCFPVVWPWPGADTIYAPNWIVENTTDAVARIRDYAVLSHEQRQKVAGENRQFLVSRYGFKRISSELTNILLSS